MKVMLQSAQALLGTGRTDDKSRRGRFNYVMRDTLNSKFSPRSLFCSHLA